MPLKEEIETKFLGVTIDNELTWQSHIDNVGGGGGNALKGPRRIENSKRALEIRAF